MLRSVHGVCCLAFSSHPFNFLKIIFILKLHNHNQLACNETWHLGGIQSTVKQLHGPVRLIGARLIFYIFFPVREKSKATSGHCESTEILQLKVGALVGFLSCNRDFLTLTLRCVRQTQEGAQCCRVGGSALFPLSGDNLCSVSEPQTEAFTQEQAPVGSAGFQLTLSHDLIYLCHASVTALWINVHEGHGQLNIWSNSICLSFVW